MVIGSWIGAFDCEVLRRRDAIRSWIGDMIEEFNLWYGLADPRICFSELR